MPGEDPSSPGLRPATVSGAGEPTGQAFPIGHVASAPLPTSLGSPARRIVRSRVAVTFLLCVFLSNIERAWLCSFTQERVPGEKGRKVGTRSPAMARPALRAELREELGEAEARSVVAFPESHGQEFCLVLTLPQRKSLLSSWGLGISRTQ